jgi:uncharacterized membrane protein YvbJ
MVGFSLLAIDIIVLVVGIAMKVPEMSDDNWFEISSRKSTIIFSGVACCMFSIPVFVMGFRVELSKMMTKSAKYIQEENKEDLKDIASTTADIASDAITKTTKAIKKGVKGTKFCKHCGAEIDEDSKFCSKCGKEL